MVPDLAPGNPPQIAFDGGNGEVSTRAVCGRRRNRDQVSSRIAIQEQEPAPLSQHVEGVPERLEEIVAKCLARDKNERYQTARDLLIDLRNLRRKLDVDAEIGLTVAPALRSTNGGALGASTGSLRADPRFADLIKRMGLPQ